MKQLDKTTKTGLATLLLALFVAACGDDPTGMDPDDDHAEPEGVELVLSGQTIATYDGDDQTWTGGMTVPVGEETAHIAVRFVDHDGDPIPLDDDMYLEVVVEDEAIAEFEQDEPGEFGGHLHGMDVGETRVRFRLMHGAVGSGHADFETTWVTATVTGMT